MPTLHAIFTKDKRKNDRLVLSLHVYYALPPDPSWQGPFVLQDISGSGLRLQSPTLISKNTSLDLKLELPGKAKPILFKGEVTWSKKVPAKKFYLIGIKFDKMTHADRQQFVRFICQELLKQNINFLTNL